MRKLGIYIIAVALIGLPLSCEKQEHTYGLVLMVDDGYIDEWYEIIDFLDQYDAKLSFYIACYHNLSESQIQKLRDFNERGYEIGYHGTQHVDASNFLINHTFDEYLEYEIFPDLTKMREAGFTVNHFAYPYGYLDTELDPLLLAHFISLRKLAWTSQEYTLPNKNQVYYIAPVNQYVLRAAGIDKAYNNPIEDIEQSIDRISGSQECLLLYCHKLTDDEGNYTISTEKVKSIVKYCYSKNVPMITISDIFRND